MDNNNIEEKRGIIFTPKFLKEGLRRMPGTPSFGFSKGGFLTFTARLSPRKTLLNKLFDKLCRK